MSTRKKFLGIGLVLFLLAGGLCFCGGAKGQVKETGAEAFPPVIDNLPVSVDALKKAEWVEHEWLSTLLDLDWLLASLSNSDNKDGLEVDLSHIMKTLDGKTVDPSKIYGAIYVCAYPFEAGETDYAYKRFRRVEDIEEGKAVVYLRKMLGYEYQSEEIWKGNKGTVMVRWDLWEKRDGEDRFLGIYDIPIGFRKNEEGIKWEQLPWITLGPMLNLVDSRHPQEVTLDFETNEAVEATVILNTGREFKSPATRRHSVKITGLTPSMTYTYRVKVGDITSRPFTFKAASLPGEGPVIFAYCADSRSGVEGDVGGSGSRFMGVNYKIMDQIAAGIYHKGADIIFFGGDLFAGETTSYRDFVQQAYAWKQSVFGLWTQRPVYPIMGNHEILSWYFKSVKDPEELDPILVDKWPYETESAEAAWREAFNLPMDGPEPSDPRRPTYKENVYTVQYGPIKIIAFNNDGYWKTYNWGMERYWKECGGLPDGYIMDDQMRWIEEEIKKADADPTVKYILLVSHTPVFPNAGHGEDAMWWFGDNNVRGYVYKDGKIQPERDGIIDVRNRLALAIASSPKVAAYLGADEHGYSRILMTKDVPVGNPSKDDKNGDGIIDIPECKCWALDYDEAEFHIGNEPASPIPLKYPTWHIISAGAGAPYYSEEPTPWSEYYKKMPNTSDYYFHTCQMGYVIFEADEDKISLKSYNLYGELIDKIDDLMAAKR